MKKILSLPFAIFMIVVLGLSAIAGPVFAKGGGPPTVHVLVCHATGSDSHPYQEVDVSVHSVDDATGLNGHGDHEDDIWASFVFNSVTYPGQGDTSIFEQGTCNPVPAPEHCSQTVDGTPSEWSDWVDNGDGTQTRTRTVPLLDANDGSDCGSRTESQTEDIPYVVCSQTTDGTPGAWSDWVDNGDGTETRTRTIPLFDAKDGSDCGSRTESQTQDIPYETCSQTVEGTPGEWSDWVDNGDGTETRTRQVPLIDAVNGASCGSRTEKQTQDIPVVQCEETVDGTPGAWSDWVDNGDGTQTRTRTVPLLDAEDNSISCGSRTEKETTETPPVNPCADGQTGRATNPVCVKKAEFSCRDRFNWLHTRVNVETVLRWMKHHKGYVFCPAFDDPPERDAKWLKHH